MSETLQDPNKSTVIVGPEKSFSDVMKDNDIYKITSKDLHKLEIINHIEQDRENSKQELNLKEKEHKLELELKKKQYENSLTSCCFKIHKPSAIFFTQVGTLGAVIIGSGIGLAMTANPILVPVFSGLISFSIGLMFPQPKINE